jgi:hypothetical protein
MEEKKKDSDAVDEALNAWAELIDWAKNDTPFPEKLDNGD